MRGECCAEEESNRDTYCYVNKLRTGGKVSFGVSNVQFINGPGQKSFTQGGREVEHCIMLRKKLRWEAKLDAEKIDGADNRGDRSGSCEQRVNFVNGEFRA